MPKITDQNQLIMKDTLEFLLKEIVDHPDEIKIVESIEEGKTILTIQANQEDIGKIVGKQGRIIKSIRNLIKLIAAKHNAYVDIIIAE
jgi:uncharacterized protein